MNSKEAPEKKIYKIISTNEILTQDEEKQMILLAQSGDEDARNKLIERNMGLVSKSAKYYKKYTQIDYDDLFQEGTIGLFTSINKFDVDKGFKFSTYATYWIKHNITRLMSNYGRTVKIPVKYIEIYRSYINEKEEYIKEFKKEPSDSEIASLLKISEHTLNQALILSKKMYSIDFEIKNTKGGGYDANLGTMGDLIEDERHNTEREIELNDTLSALFKAIENLEPIEKLVVLETFNLNNENRKKKTKTEIVKELKLKNTNKLNTILNKALKKLKLELSEIDNIYGLFE